MGLWSVITAVALWAALSGGVQASDAPGPAVRQLVEQGAHGVAPCVACHGARGEGNAAAGYPRLAGLAAPYLLAELQAFASGARDSAPMAPVARALSAAERAALAGYYASLAARGAAAAQPATAAASADAAADAPYPGAELALHGRWAQDIPACVQCHGRGGVGIGSAFPPLAGQPARYLAAQLRAWRSGTRHDDPQGLMQQVARRLTEEDIDLVSRYFEQFAALDTQRLAVAAPAAGPGEAPISRVEPATRSPGGRSIPDSDFGRVVELGRRIFNDTPKYAGSYVGNRLNCSNCHLDQGRRAGSAPMWAAYVSYPSYRAKTRQVNTFAERLQGCFRYSMNGREPALGDPVLVALESYAYWMALGVTVDPDIPGRGYGKAGAQPLPADYARGERVYARHCALCHGAAGGGQQAADGSPGFPALWGADSFNWGAGMGSIANAAAFIRSNMPLGAAGTLSDQEAWDVARYMDSHDRPQDPRFTGSVADTRARYHDGPDWTYGTVVNGELLGSHSPPPGPRGR